MVLEHQGLGFTTSVQQLLVKHINQTVMKYSFRMDDGMVELSIVGDDVMLQMRFHTVIISFGIIQN